jgi:uncharacterized membrane protein
LGILVIFLDLKKAISLKQKSQLKNEAETQNKNILALALQSKRWQQQSLLLSSGIIFTIPWLLWGTKQQLSNADLERFKAGSNLLETSWQHLEGILSTLGINLLVGDWASILPPTMVNIAGVVATILIIASITFLWRKQHLTLLLIAVSLSLLPLLLMVAIDVISGKFTVGFGFGRSLIMILPGCLLLFTATISKMKPRWQTYIAIALLICYLSTNVADFSLRQRQMFHNLAALIQQQPNTPTLIIMNSTAWGHVLRLAYYLPETKSIELLAQPSAKLNNALTKTLQNNSQNYQRLIWLNSDRPVWGKPITEADKQALQTTITQQYQLKNETRLIGTWELDNFDVRVYEP